MPKKIKVASEDAVVQIQGEEAAPVVTEPAPKKASKVEKTDKVVTEPKTMEELMAQFGADMKVPKRGDVVEGLVTDVGRRMVQVDIGGKTEGIVIDKEFEVALDYIGQLKIGDKVSVYIVSAENERGQILLSLKKAAMDQKWDYFKKAMETGEAIEVRGLELNKGGMIVVSEGIRGFVPTSQFGKAVVGNLDSLLNRSFKTKVIEVDREKNRLIFSERHVSEEALMKQKASTLDAIKVGETYTGVVSGILPFGAFVTVNVPIDGDKDPGHIEGLVHISEISWEKVDDPGKYLQMGEEVTVRVLGIDAAAGKLNLSIKQLIPDPWVTAKEHYPEGTVVKGVVSRIASFGVFVHLEAGIDGLIHISKIMDGEMPRVGEDVSVTVESVDPDARRMSLSLTPTEVPIGYK
jgi:ribosomal protein S1